MPTKKKPAATPPAKPARPDHEIELQLRCPFTDKELLELGKKMAESTTLLAQQETEAKAIANQLKAKCNATAARISEASSKITAGYEFRAIRCITKYDTPKTGQKTVIRTDTGETVEVTEMSLQEMQLPLPLEPGTEKPTAAPGVVPVPADSEPSSVMPGAPQPPPA